MKERELSKMAPSKDSLFCAINVIQLLLYKSNKTIVTKKFKIPNEINMVKLKFL